MPRFNGHAFGPARSISKASSGGLPSATVRVATVSRGHPPYTVATSLSYQVGPWLFETVEGLGVDQGIPIRDRLPFTILVTALSTFLALKV